MSNARDAELRTRLAESQADLEVNLAALFGFLAALLAFDIGLEQIYFNLSSKEGLARGEISIVIVIWTVILFLILMFFAGRMQTARKQISDLKKEYVW